MPAPSSFGRAMREPQGHDFIGQRNDYLNAFALLETALCKLAKKHSCAGSDGASIGQRLDAFDKLKPSSQLSSANLEKIKELANSISGILKIRNCIVHGVMTVGQKHSASCAMFQNAGYAAAGIPMYLVLSADELSAATKQTNDFTNALDRLLNLTSSPPQPKQGAATGP